MIDYYYDMNYNRNKNEFDKYVNPDTLTLYPIENKPDNSYELWMGANINDVNHNSFDVYFDLFYKNILSILKIKDSSISTRLFQPEPYLETIYNNLSEPYKNIDILVINCEPQSGQFAYSKNEFDNMCIRLSKNYKIVTTDPVLDTITCTRRENLTMQDIGAISTKSKYVIAIHSGPLTTCFNESAEKYVKKWFMFQININFNSHPNIIVFRNSDELHCIEKYLSEQYKYTKSWFINSEINQNLHNFINNDTKNTILEIGCYEGLSSVFFADNLLHHQESSLTCVDPFLQIDTNDHAQFLQNNEEDNFDYNISHCNHADKITVHKVTSDAFFKTNTNRYNFIYIDGCHECDFITRDMENAFAVLEKNGIMWMDDYGGGDGIQIKNTMDMFLEKYKGQYTIINSGYQLGIKKL